MSTATIQAFRPVWVLVGMLVLYAQPFAISQVLSGKASYAPSAKLEVTADRDVDLGEYGKAARLYLQALDIDKYNPRLMEKAAKAEEAAGDMDGAIELLEGLRRRVPSPHVVALLDGAKCEIGDRSAAAEATSMFRPMTDSIDDGRIVAPCFLLAGDELVALGLFERFLAPGQQVTTFELLQYARAAFRASKHFADELRARSDSASYVALLDTGTLGKADLETALGDALKAAPHVSGSMDALALEKALEADSHSADAIFAVSVICKERAQAVIELAEQKDPSSAEIDVLYAEMAMAVGQPQLAVARYEKAMQDPTLSEGLRYRLAVAYLAANRVSEALAQFDSLLMRHPGNVHILQGKSECLLRLNQLEPEKTLLNELLARSDPPSWVLDNHATLNEREDNPMVAIQDLNRLIARGNADPTFHYRLSKLYRAVKDGPHSTEQLKLFLAQKAASEHRSQTASTDRLVSSEHDDSRSGYPSTCW